MEQNIYIKNRIDLFYSSRKKSLSFRYKFLIPYILLFRRAQRFAKDVNKKIAKGIVDVDIYMQSKYSVLYRHNSPLRRKLGDDIKNDLLQNSKIKNLEIASKKINGLVIKSGETFSLWKALGGPATKEKGYQDGIMLSGGKVVSGIGGGLCQLSNLLYFIVLHTELEVIERHHHSMDVFKDSGRKIPFGTGATICFPRLDFRFKNIYPYDIVLNIFTTNTQLVGKILSRVKNVTHKYHILEKDSIYYKYKGLFYRFNRVYRQEILEGEVLKEYFMYENLFPTLYTPDTFIELV